ncbi:MAG TPA: hypothetical protein VF960_01485 [Chloroflexota bacterium]
MGASPTTSIKRTEWAWVAGCAAVLALLVAAPYAVALLHPPQGFLMQRTLFYGGDLSQYLAAMGDGAASPSWLVRDHLTAEAHSPAFMYPFYVLLGKVGALLGLPPLPLFAFFSIFAIPAFVFGAYYFAAGFIDSHRQRAAATLFVLFSSGFGIWVAAAGALDPAGTAGPSGFAYDRAEVSSYLLPFGPPHLTFALALLLVWGRALADWSWGGGARNLAIMAVAVLGVSLLNSFTAAPMLVLAGGYAAVRWIALGRFPSREAGAALLAGAAAAPVLAASLATFALDPFWSVTYGRQNTTGSPPVWALAVDFGFSLLLAAIGLTSRKVPATRRGFLGFWVVALALMMYAPVGFQRRFGFGLQPALAVAAALGAARAGDFLRRWPRASLQGLLARLSFNTVVVVGLFSGTILGYGLFLVASSGGGPAGAAIFEPAGNVAAADWLASHSTRSDVVLASVETSNYLAGRIRGSVVVGHKAGTLDYPEKEALMKRFFAAGAVPGEAARLAEQLNASLVFVGDRERALGAQAPGTGDGFDPIYDAGGVRIYRVGRPGAGGR